MTTKSAATFDSPAAATRRSRRRGGTLNTPALLRVDGEVCTYVEGAKRLSLDEDEFRRRVIRQRRRGPLTWESLK